MTFQLSLFDAQPDFDKSIRRTDENGTVYFSLIDIMAQFSDTKAAGQYWRDTKKRLKSDGFQLKENILQLRLPSSDGKLYKTDCADGQTCLRIVQSIPSPKAEPIRQWLAQLGYERIEETANPELGIERSRQRAAASYHKQGKEDAWVEARFKGVVSRKLFTDTLKAVVSDSVDYPAATDAINVGLFGRTAKQLSKETGSANTRDRMTIPALNAVSSVEWSSAQFLGDRQSIPFDQAVHFIEEIAHSYRVPLQHIQDLLGMDLATGKSLLSGASQ